MMRLPPSSTLSSSSAASDVYKRQVYSCSQESIEDSQKQTLSPSLRSFETGPLACVITGQGKWLIADSFHPVASPLQPPPPSSCEPSGFDQQQTVRIGLIFLSQR
eukprot:TRINITY_DN41682_c0_g1_i1.p1 TRINITY_DN41682_c0_g1~~TRINITY_DN41682_c0_g1_i1.p1  ORF type:complete len:105 (-),score=9.38 TRINITY_DN41682_c0_g1_i1:60-374(-)